MNHRLTVLALATASLLPLGAAQAGHFHHDCDVNFRSDYDLRISAPRRRRAQRSGSTPDVCSSTTVRLR